MDCNEEIVLWSLRIVGKFLLQWGVSICCRGICFSTWRTSFSSLVLVHKVLFFTLFSLLFFLLCDIFNFSYISPECHLLGIITCYIDIYMLMMRDLNTDTDKKKNLCTIFHVCVLFFKFCILDMPQIMVLLL